MKVLVTGSTGHLGEALVRTLRVHHEVVGIDILPSEFTSNVGSIQDQALVSRIMAGVDTVFHTATLHKPHISTHTRQDFIDINISGTLCLLENATTAGVKNFIFTSSTSTFGDALTPPQGAPAAWITESVRPIPKNIYGMTKTAAEDMCKLFYRNNGLACIVLKTSRFFPEADDQPNLRQAYADANLKANEFLYRRVDVEDVVSAHICAMKKAQDIGFGTYIISATTPFAISDAIDLGTNAPRVVRRLFPQFEELYSSQGWRMLPTIDRVYVNTLAKKELEWHPKHDFDSILSALKSQTALKSPLAQAIGIKGYHKQEFGTGPYPV